MAYLLSVVMGSRGVFCIEGTSRLSGCAGYRLVRVMGSHLVMVMWTGYSVVLGPACGVLEVDGFRLLWGCWI